MGSKENLIELTMKIFLASILMSFIFQFNTAFELEKISKEGGWCMEDSNVMGICADGLDCVPMGYTNNNKEYGFCLNLDNKCYDYETGIEKLPCKDDYLCTPFNGLRGQYCMDIMTIFDSSV